MTYRGRVVVMPKPAVNDPQGVAVRHGLLALGYDGVGDVRVGKFIELTVEAGSEGEASGLVEAMCRRLLANRVIEDYHLDVVELEPEPA